MRTKAMIGLSVLVLAALNYGIYEKEQIKEHGRTLFIELAPADPRSLMQGDYMRLRYDIESHATAKHQASPPMGRHIVVRPDHDNVAQFVRFHKSGDLEPGEALLRFHWHLGSVRIVPDSFFFQEGHAKHYQNAKYGVFKFDKSGKILLVGLADDTRKEIVARDLEKKLQ
jgi:uncharacterized membrane-anchored protein